ncbi:conserved hypothetical protein [Candidatus Propionivibrio aalborgensis]|uniref:Uncharacterized protein n=1 Tax=Candidatus Propionivibrio aalborgensis TaxID=1860101 RepID=A0A1A8Y243_9RHOO|nr:three component ABC system middle component [Candidatus Propionivibrio aalborgensis]SBT11209.1 conserved hypothetical protein [Candidatus Propionivibrio aalborgensis]
MTTVKSWARRPPDVANLFNPAFCAALLNRLAVGFQGDVKQGLPYPLAFLALPLLLHSGSVALLPPTARTRFHSWILENPQVLFGFPERAKALAPIVREAVSFGLRYELLGFGPEQILIPLAASALKRWEKNPYNKDLSKDAQTLGKLFAQVKDLPTIFALFGVRP